MTRTNEGIKLSSSFSSVDIGVMAIDGTDPDQSNQVNQDAYFVERFPILNAVVATTIGLHVSV